jgi:hypothetical protein
MEKDAEIIAISTCILPKLISVQISPLQPLKNFGAP